ncbi:Serine/threonine-protein kinase [Irineochytrium annulatum]|nr:Serine/threonine-protein kinase [Irineochytrium annulatum]
MAGYKPIYLPEDNPTDYTYFFDSSSRRTCYVAPERFLAPGETLFTDKQRRLTPAMDVFSMGCTIAELFLEGSTIFSFSQLLRYRSNEYDPTNELEKIDDPHIKTMIKSMIQLDPALRESADFYLQQWRGLAFPDYFYTLLHGLFADLSDPASCQLISSQVVALQGSSRLILADSDSKVERIYTEFGRIADALGMRPAGAADAMSARSPGVVSSWKKMFDKRSNKAVKGQSILPLNLNLPDYVTSTASISPNPSSSDGAIIFTCLLTSTIRNVLFPSSKIKALDLLLAFGIHLADEHKLDRIVPYLVALLPDEMAMVRANALKILTQLLSIVETIGAGDVNIFPEYILPSLHRLSVDPDVFVRSTYAQCIASLAESALRFLELAQAFKQGNTDAELESDLHLVTYDSALRDLHEAIQDEVVALLIDPSPHVKRALLSEMPSLCIFFGQKRANDVLLGHMITYLNDLDWQLRSAFFESIVGVGTFVGSRSLEEYILPLTLQALTDAEEFVVEKVLAALTSLAELGLMQKPKLREMVTMILPLLCHPNVWIRNGE